MQVKRLTNAIGDELNDLELGNEHVRWPVAQLFEYITEALEQISALKPELFSVSEVVRLRPGSAQVIPSKFSKLLDVVGNVNLDGSAGDSIVMSNFALMRSFNKPSCITSTGKIFSFRVDPNEPRSFLVSPPATSYPPQFVRILGQSRPEVITSTNNTIAFTGGDVSTYFNAIKDWALYRAFMKDTESQSSMQRATQHYRAFYQFFDVKVRMDAFNKAQRNQIARQGDQNESEV